MVFDPSKGVLTHSDAILTPSGGVFDAFWASQGTEKCPTASSCTRSCTTLQTRTHEALIPITTPLFHQFLLMKSLYSSKTHNTGTGNQWVYEQWFHEQRYLHFTSRLPRKLWDAAARMKQKCTVQLYAVRQEFRINSRKGIVNQVVSSFCFLLFFLFLCLPLFILLNYPTRVCIEGANLLWRDVTSAQEADTCSSINTFAREIIVRTLTDFDSSVMSLGRIETCTNQEIRTRRYDRY